MITLKATTKKAMDIIDRYNASDLLNLSYVYKNAGISKRMAERDIRRIMEDMKGYRCRIVSFNKMMFTCGFTYEDENGSPRLRYFTRDYTYDMALQSA